MQTLSATRRDAIPTPTPTRKHVWELPETFVWDEHDGLSYR
jgi:hypothetical protein